MAKAQEIMRRYRNTLRALFQVKEPLWMEAADAPAIHDSVPALHGGATGLRDEKRLESALARPRQYASYDPAPDLPGMAALYAAGIVRGNPFADGSQRTGFIIAVLFLELNGYRFTASEEDATQAIEGLAAGSLSGSEFASWMRARSVRRRSTRKRRE
jgi:death-on-curing protein